MLLSHGKYNRTRELASPQRLCRNLKGKGRCSLLQERDFRAEGLGCTVPFPIISSFNSFDWLIIDLLTKHLENLLKNISSTINASRSAKVTANSLVAGPVRFLAVGSAVVGVAKFDIKTRR
jgi:hypothetical protein